jgi:nitroreductase
MELQDAVLGRRSIRQFLPKPVSEEMIKDLIVKSLWSPDRNKLRYKALGKSVLGALAIAREDQQARADHFARMFSCFDAPAVVIFSLDKTLLLEYAMLDVGLILQTFCLLAHGKGLGTCILAAVVTYPEIVRKVFSIPETKRLVMGAALGWPDSEALVNSFERNRGDLEEFIRWVS